MTCRFSGTVAVIVIASLVSGCGASSPRHDARVAGVVALCGGPAPGHCFTEPVRVSVLDSTRQPVAESHSSNGRFSFAVAPGAYTVTAHAGRYTVGTAAVRTIADRTTRANITNHEVK